MKIYELTLSDYKEIYEKAVREFNETSMDKKQRYAHYLTRCLVSSFTGFLKARKLEVRNGDIYVSTED